ncbi:MAG: RibD family protein [Archangium sp.]|nr:RibD family protein [Archangium sp.]
MAFAVSADGCLAATRGYPTPISSPASLELTHHLRAVHDAVLVGVGTVLADDPLLTTRLAPGPSPRRVVLDSRLRTPETARLLTSGGAPPLVLTTAAASPERIAALTRAGAHVEVVGRCASGVSLSDALRALARRGVTTVMVEGGAAVLDSFFSDGLVDFAVQTVAPLTLGPGALQLGRSTQQALSRWVPQQFSLGPDSIAVGTWSRE